MMHIIIRSDTPWRIILKLWNTSTSNSIVVSSKCCLVRPIVDIGCAFTSTNIKNCLMTFGPLTSNVFNVNWMSDYKYVWAMFGQEASMSCVNLIFLIMLHPSIIFSKFKTVWNLCPLLKHFLCPYRVYFFTTT
jgi:hypothetical protein